MDDEEKTKDIPRTTVRIKKINIVKQHMINKNFSSLKKYLNNLIEQDILRTGDEEIITKYFKEGRPD